MLTDFRNSFTARFTSKLTQRSHYISTSHHILNPEKYLCSKIAILKNRVVTQTVMRDSAKAPACANFAAEFFRILKGAFLVMLALFGSLAKIYSQRPL